MSKDVVLKYRYVIVSTLLLTIVGCEKLTDPILAAINTPPQVLKERAQISGKPVDAYVYSIVLRYGLNGADVDIEEANRLEASAIGDAQIIPTGTGVAINYGNKIDPMTRGAVNRCISALDVTVLKKPSGACGSEKDFHYFKVLWDEAKSK